MEGYILITDPEITTQSFLRKTLQAAGFATKSVASGDECLRLSFSHERPSLIFLAWEMPVLTGLEILNLLKLDRRSKSIPVIMISEEDRGKMQAYLVGAAAFFVKPLAAERFLPHVFEALGDDAADYLWREEQESND